MSAGGVWALCVLTIGEFVMGWVGERQVCVSGCVYGRTWA